MSTLLKCIFLNDPSEIKAMLDAGVDVDELDEDRRTPLMHAVTCEKASLDVVCLLLDSGADVNASDAQGWTALHFAAQERRADFIERFVQAGAETDAMDAFGNTPLARAVFASKGNNAAVKALLAAGANPDKANKSGVSPRTLANSISNYDVASAFE